MIRIAPILLLCGLLAACATRPVAPSRPLPPPAAPLSVPVPDTVTGLSASALRAGFGAPALMRKDGIAEIWRYDGTRGDGAPCRAFFFLYDEQGIQVVRHVETTPPDASAACLSALRVKP